MITTIFKEKPTTEQLVELSQNSISKCGDCGAIEGQTDVAIVKGLCGWCRLKRLKRGWI